MQSATIEQTLFTKSSCLNNNNVNVRKNDKYSLRQRYKRQCTRLKNQIDHQVTTTSSPIGTISSIDVRKTKQKPKPKAAPLSKYRRKTANARERTRMREINSAFENLRKCVPLSISNDDTPTTTTNEKLTKITTLRLAMKYIRALNEVLSKPGNSDHSLILNNIVNNNNNNNNSNSLNFNNNTSRNNNNLHSHGNSKHLLSDLYFAANSNVNKKSKLTKSQPKKRTKFGNNNYSSMKKIMLSPCLTPPIDDDMDLGLMLESDGESLHHFSDQCLCPSPHGLKCNSNSNALELGILLKSDSDSLQLSEPCLSPLGNLDPLNPFSDLLHTEFSEQSSLDMMF